MPPPRSSTLKILREIFGPERVSSTREERFAYSRDQWPRLLFEMRAGMDLDGPAYIVWPQSAEEISRLLKWAQSSGTPVTPWGGGSGVCGGAVPRPGGIVLDTKRMNRIVAVDRQSLTVTAQAGILGQCLEEALQAKGFSLGHFPASMYCSTLGGWLATRSAGQLSSRYGKIEDMAIRMEFVLPNGGVVQTGKAPRSATGPSLLQLLLGSEGTLGVITEATVAIHPLPQADCFQAYLFEAISPGLDGIRRLIQSGIRPGVVRLYDELETSLSLRTQGLELEGCLLILRFEGHPELVRTEASTAQEILREAGGRELGPGPAQHWWQHRYSISFQQSPLLYEPGTFFDTVEVATTWNRVKSLYRALKEAIGSQALVMAHFSHVYPQGASIYFTFVGKAPGKEVEMYQTIWRRAMELCLEHGGTISHHHGIGRLKAPWMAKEHGEGMEVIRAIKKAVDPQGILNPGNMGL